MQDLIKIWVGNTEDYKLLDCGDKKKLEEVGRVRIVRAEPRAWWKKELPEEEWKKAESFAPQGESLEKIIDVGVGEIKAKIKYKNTSKHIGIFPEQVKEWEFIKEKIEKWKEGRKEKAEGTEQSEVKLNVLNLFGYTGIATLVAAKAGAKVTHVDASKQSVDWARENQKLSGLENAPIRWIVDDVIKFVKKEAKQGKKYDAIIMDPPSYGKGPKGEVWKIEEKLPDLLSVCREILSNQPLFVVFNMYSTELSSISVANLLADMTAGLGGTIESSELVIKQQNSDHLLPMSIFAVWEK